MSLYKAGDCHTTFLSKKPPSITNTFSPFGTTLVGSTLLSKLAKTDAHYMIAKTVVDCAIETNNPVIVVAQDTDIMVLLLEHCTTQNIYMLRPRTSGKPNKLTNMYALENISIK